MKYQNGVEKTLLRDAFSDVLPPELLHRKKSPYPKTYHPGYEALLINGMEEILDSPNAPVRTLIDTDKTREFLKAPAEYVRGLASSWQARSLSHILSRLITGWRSISCLPNAHP